MWCEICRKYCTHTTETCFKRPKGLNQQYQQARYDQRGYQNQRPYQNQGYQNQGYPNQGNPQVRGNAANVEKAVLVLGTQPLLPGAVAVRYVDVALDEGVNPPQDLVPVGMYYKKEYP